MSVYLSRIEEKNGFYNLRPIMELLPDNHFSLVDRSVFGQYGTITIGKNFNFSHVPYIKDQTYWLFPIDDSQLIELEEHGYEITPKEFLDRYIWIDTYPIREVVEIPYVLDITDPKQWSKEFSGIEAPLSKDVYLANENLVLGPFTWERSSDDYYKFYPNANPDENGDRYTLRCYYKSDCVDIIYGFYSNWKHRHVLKTDTLPDNFAIVDCIDDDKLKELVAKRLSQSATTKKEKRDIEDSILNLPTTQLSESRQKRILSFVKEGMFVDEVINQIPNILMDNPESADRLVSALLNNSNFIHQLYPVIREKEGFQEPFAKVNDELYSTKNELDQTIAKLNEVKSQLKEHTSVSSDEMNQKNAELAEAIAKSNQLEEELTEYRKLGDLDVRYNKLQKDYNILDQKYATLNQDYDAQLLVKRKLDEKIQDIVRSGYADLAFDGAVSSMLLQEAANFERKRNQDAIQVKVAKLDKVDNKRPIESPKELVKYLHTTLNDYANRDLSENDIANVLICLSQGFLTVFAGEPGCGKTSLVSLLAKILGLSNSQYPRYQEIAVEKGWTSRRDLIGYYNPLTKSFEAANMGMFTALTTLEAEFGNNVSDFPYWILLDEANLSQMEHYWADFMSLCDFDKSVRQVSLNEDYVFRINDTLRFLATINLDHTTEGLSPRLVDRAWVIKVQSSNVDIDDFIEPNLKSEYPLVQYDVFKQLSSSEYWKSQVIDDAIVERFSRIRTIFHDEGIDFSPRVIGMIRRYCLASKDLIDTSKNTLAALDYAVAQKILPMIDGYGERYREFVEKLMTLCDSNSMPICFNILSDILKKGEKNMNYYQFFAR